MITRSLLSPEAIADVFQGDLIPIIHEGPPARVAGMIWRGDFDDWSQEFLEHKVRFMLIQRKLARVNVIARQLTTDGRPFVLCQWREPS
jgi:hypothetical protein